MTDNKESVNLKLAFLKKWRSSRAGATVILKRKLLRGKKNQCVCRKKVVVTYMAKYNIF